MCRCSDRRREGLRVKPPSVSENGTIQAGELELLTSTSQNERDFAILQCRMRGVTLQEIGKVTGLTRERVRQICLREAKSIGKEASIRAIRQRVKTADREKLEKEHKRLRRLWSEALLDRPGLSLDELLVRTPVPDDVEASPLRILSPCIARFLRRTPKRGSSARSRSEIQSHMIRALQHAATYEVPLSRSTFDELVTLGEIESPSSHAVSLMYGSWSDACEAAGIECFAPRRSAYGRQWSRSEMIRLLTVFVLDHRATTTFAGYESWRGIDGVPVAPSSALVRQRLGSWSHVMNQTLDAIAASAVDRAHVQQFQQCVDGHREWH
jgi:DNA-binding transcriptional MerR regulator